MLSLPKWYNLGNYGGVIMKRISLSKLSGAIISEVLRGTPIMVTRDKRDEAVLLRVPSTEEDKKELVRIIDSLLAERNNK